MSHLVHFLKIIQLINAANVFFIIDNQTVIIIIIIIY